MAELSIFDSIEENDILTIIGTEEDDNIDISDETERVDVFAGEGDDFIIAGDGNNEIFGGAGEDEILGGLGNEFLYGGSELDDVEDDSDLIDGGAGDDIIVGDAGDDDLYGSEGFDALYGELGDDYLDGGEGDDDLFGDVGDDTLNGGDGDDALFPGSGNDFINGGEGADLVYFDFNQVDISNATPSSDGQVTIIANGETKILNDIETISFADDTLVDVGNLNIGVSDETPPTTNDRPFFRANDGEGGISEIAAELYDGPLSYLTYQFISDGSQSILFGSEDNDFLKLGDGDDAANGGEGRDVLDGGAGSNFLTGGNGDDTFFLQGLGDVTTWSTVTDFTSGDNVTAWGWADGTSQLIDIVEDAGAEGFKGATFHYDIDGNGLIDTSITFTGMTVSEVPDTLSDVIDNNGYLLFA